MWPELDPARRARTAAKPVSATPGEVKPTAATAAAKPGSSVEQSNGRAADASAR
jgi:hypothetical protein